MYVSRRRDKQMGTSRSEREDFEVVEQAGEKGRQECDVSSD